MRVFLRRVSHSDPVAFTVAFAVWCFCVGAGLIAPGSVFNLSPAWQALSVLHANETDWGYFMVANGMFLLAAVRMQRIPHRAAITLASAITWGVLGVSMVYAGWTGGRFISTVGCFSVWCSFQAMMAVDQWVYHGTR